MRKLRKLFNFPNNIWTSRSPANVSSGLQNITVSTFMFSGWYSGGVNLNETRGYTVYVSLIFTVSYLSIFEIIGPPPVVKFLHLSAAYHLPKMDYIFQRRVVRDISEIECNSSLKYTRIKSTVIIRRKLMTVRSKKLFYHVDGSSRAVHRKINERILTRIFEQLSNMFTNCFGYISHISKWSITSKSQTVLKYLCINYRIWNCNDIITVHAKTLSTVINTELGFLYCLQ